MSKITDVYKGTENAIDEAIITNRLRITKSIKRFEKNIINTAHDTLGVDAGDMAKRRSLKTAIQFHKNLINEFELTYGKTALTTSNELKSIATIVRKEFKGLDIPLSFTTADRDMFEAVRKSALNGYVHLGEDAVSKITQSVYDSVITGQSFNTLVSSIQSSTGTLGKYAQLRAHDSLMNYYTTLNVKKADDAGIESFLYYGNIIATTRPFCMVRAGRVFTIKEIQSWDSMHWSGKRPGSTLINRGGYNCRHSLHPCKPEWVEDGKIDVQNWHDQKDGLSPNEIKAIKAEEKKLTMITPLDKLGKITPGKVISSQGILKQHDDAWTASYAENKSASELKVNVAHKLGKKMYGLKSDKMDDFIRFTSGSNVPVTDLYDYQFAANKLIDQWSITSGDANPRSIMMQLAAQSEFGLEGTSIWWDKKALAEAKVLFTTHGTAARTFLREMYNDTQEYLTKQGLKTLRVSRGYKGDMGIIPSTPINPMAKTSVLLQPMSSFSGNVSIARRFSGSLAEKKVPHKAMMFAEVPANRILSCPVTGYGCMDEYEYIVLGSQKGAETILSSMVTKEQNMSWGKLFNAQTSKEFKIKMAEAIHEVIK